MTNARVFSYGPLRPEKARKIESTDPRVSGGYGRRRRPRAAAGHQPGAASAPAVVPERDGAIRSIQPPRNRQSAHIAGLASARAPAKGTILKNVRQTLRMAALTAVLASAPLSLTNAIASADFERVTPNVPSTPFAPAGFVSTPDAPPADDAPRAPDAPPAPDAPNVAPVADAPPAPADLPPAPDAPPAPAPDAPPAPPAPEAPPAPPAPEAAPAPGACARGPCARQRRSGPGASSGSLRGPTASTGTRSPRASPVATGRISTGNGYSGGLQFTPSTWRANGGSGSPNGASREEQIRVAENVLHSQGIGAWPVCGRRG